MMIRTTLIGLMVIGCGADKSSEMELEKKGNYSLATTSTDLPECTDANINQLAYVEDLAEFRACKEGGWINIEIGNQTFTEIVNAGVVCADGGVKIVTGKDEKYVCNGSKGDKGEQGEQGDKGEQGIAGLDGSDGDSGLVVAEQWEYNTQSYASSLSVAGEAANMGIYLGNIQVTLMSNGHYYATVSGIVYDETANESHDFSHSMWFTGSDVTTIQTAIRKIDYYADLTIGYNFQKVDGIFVLVSTADVDGNYGNNLDSDLIQTNLNQVY